MKSQVRLAGVFLVVALIATVVLTGTASSRPTQKPLDGMLVWEVDVLNSNPAVNGWAQGLNQSIAKAGGELVRSFAVNQAGQVDLALQAQGFDRAIAAKPDAIVMHPGPMNRDVEIDSDVADGPRSVIRRQVANGLAVRMAVLAEVVEARRASAP